MGKKKGIIKRADGDIKWSDLTDDQKDVYDNDKSLFKQYKSDYFDDALDTSVGPPNPQDHLADYTGLLDILQGYSETDREDRQLFEGQQRDKDRLNAVAIANIESASKDSVASIYAGADIFGSQVTLSGYNLLDARERDLTEYTTKVEDARLRDFKDKDIAYGLNLQNIINKGLLDVAEMQGKYSVSGIATRGRYDTEIQRIRTAGDRDIAQMNMYAGMMQAMGF